MKEKLLLELSGVKTWFPLRAGLFGRENGQVKAVDDVSLTVGRGETLGLVGESGCGKTTLGRTILRLIEPTGGKAFFEGRDVFTMSPGELKTLRRKMQIIFQDPYSSLNPRMTVGKIVAEPLEIHNIARGRELEEKVAGLLAQVGLRPEHISRYPHEFSGGQRQRVGIARALALNPDFIVADEPVSALDVSVQAQVLNLMGDLKDQFGIAYLFISHDLSVIKHISDRVAVMYLGKVVEEAPRDEIFNNPVHPYTEALLSSVPVPDPDTGRKKIILKGDLPSPASPPNGCYFHTRCPVKKKECETVTQTLKEVKPGHSVACMVKAP